MNRIEQLLEGLNDWRNKTGRFLNKQPIVAHEAHRYLPTFYKVEAWFLTELAKQWELENSETYPVKIKKNYLKVEKL